MIIPPFPVEAEGDVTVLDVPSGKGGSFQPQRFGQMTRMFCFRRVDTQQPHACPAFKQQRVAINDPLHEIRSLLVERKRIWTPQREDDSDRDQTQQR